MARRFILLLSIAVAFPCILKSQSGPTPTDSATVVVERNVMVAMRDGVRLATDLYFPAKEGVRIEGKFPAVMERTPYNKDGVRNSWALYPTSNIFKAGHRIRLDLSSSNFPRFDVNPNTGEALNDHRRMITATNTIYFDSAHPSHVVLPVTPKR